MRLKLPLFLLIIATISCSSIKKTQEALNYGNYDEAINIAVKNLRSNKFKKGNQPYVLMLEEGFKKVVDRDLERISFLKKEGNKASLEEIYNIYTTLSNRQNVIRPLLPLKILNRGKDASFNFVNYSNEIISSKNNLTEYLYVKAKETLANSVHKYDFRAAFDDLNYLNELNPDYKDTNLLIEDAHFKGTDFVFVSMLNKSNKIIPIQLEKDLLDFNTYKLNDLWTVYHNRKQQKINYDYQLEIYLSQINISPERISERQVESEKEIKDGWEYVKDAKGNVKKDSTGKSITVDIYKSVRCKLKEVTQTKSTQVVGVVKYYNIKTNQLMQSFPLASEFIFENKYATIRGDKRALSSQQKSLASRKFIPFPSNEQMVYDSGENLKEKVKHIITSNKFRRN
ncbi:hypothetical protein SAMN05444411_102497 [Lutibacter oricola]|uniref:Lipoprotein n=1 Tax=Lutibacter oricola TaxID=762486 RepID=A0A1H2XKG9_9FLAO|nr:hypothetical protein [Lutibacter oricola]SDW93307.1 hypothetical protein SAMN05444411_102497 [Lutibacter oricola]